jgi:fluoroacetyl-CoA thioesterase
MKKGLEIGTTARVTDVVTPTMQPAFAGAVVHPVYGTVAMVYHMEWAARQVILPFLSDDEEGIGTGVKVRHLHPAPIGTEIEAKAICTSIHDNVITCDVEVWAMNHLIGEGSVEQRIVLRKSLHERFPEVWPGSNFEEDVYGQNGCII